MTKPPTPFTITRQDRRDAARIEAMEGQRQARDRTACIAIGHAIHVHLEAKNLPHGATDRYGEALFGKAWDTLRPCLRLYQKQAGLADADALAAQHPEWDHHRRRYEPERSLALAAETRKPEGSAGKQSRGGSAENDGRKTDWLRLLTGDCRVHLRDLPDRMAQAGIASVPYHGLREYSDLPEEIGREPSVEQWATGLAQEVFRQVKRVLADPGILWIVCGDRVARGTTKAEPPNDWRKHPRPARPADTLPVGNVMDLPGRLAHALQDDGWMWRWEGIWETSGQTSRGQKRPQVTHQKILMFTKSMRYDYYQKAVQEPTVGILKHLKDLGSVWRIPQDTASHGAMAAYPVELVRRLMLLSTKPGEPVLDPFLGTGTTGVVAKMLGRRFTGIELNPKFAAYASQRIAEAPDQPPAKWQTPIAASEVDLLKEQVDGLKENSPASPKSAITSVTRCRSPCIHTKTGRRPHMNEDPTNEDAGDNWVGSRRSCHPDRLLPGDRQMRKS